MPLTSAVLNSGRPASRQSIIERELEILSGIQVKFGFLSGGQCSVGRRRPGKELVEGRYRRIVINAELPPGRREVFVA